MVNKKKKSGFSIRKFAEAHLIADKYASRWEQQYEDMEEVWCKIQDDELIFIASLPGVLSDGDLKRYKEFLKGVDASEFAVFLALDGGNVDPSGVQDDVELSDIWDICCDAWAEQAAWLRTECRPDFSSRPEYPGVIKNRRPTEVRRIAGDAILRPGASRLGRELVSAQLGQKEVERCRHCFGTGEIWHPDKGKYSPCHACTVEVVEMCEECCGRGYDEVYGTCPLCDGNGILDGPRVAGYLGTGDEKVKL